MSQNLSSVAVEIGALRVKSFWTCSTDEQKNNLNCVNLGFNVTITIQIRLQLNTSIPIPMIGILKVDLLLWTNHLSQIEGTYKIWEQHPPASLSVFMRVNKRYNTSHSHLSPASVVFNSTEGPEYGETSTTRTNSKQHTSNWNSWLWNTVIIYSKSCLKRSFINRQKQRS